MQISRLVAQFNQQYTLFFRRTKRKEDESISHRGGMNPGGGGMMGSGGRK
jgi:hypothetical protein